MPHDTRPARAGRVGALVRRLMSRLPKPRDEAALGVLRSLRALVRGTELPALPGSQPAPPANGYRGRWARIVAEAQERSGELDTESSDPSEAAAVRAGWILIDAHERLSTRAAGRVFGHELAAWFEYAEQSVEPLKAASWADTLEVQEDRHNMLRYRRTMDFAREGDRVFDVGFGRGYLASLLIRDVGVASYHGIDVVERFVPMVSELLEVNGLADASVTVEMGDLFALTRQQVEATGANLVICCEVLEHVPDAEAALRTLAEALPDGADLLFSVPLHGRLESVWGHVSVFDVARLKEMLDGAGLVAHHVEPLANTWSLVVASRSKEPSQRVREAATRPPVRVAVPLTQERDFVDITPDDMTPTGSAELDLSVKWPACSVTGTGGVEFPIKGLEALRIRLGFTDVEHVTRFVVTAFAGGETACRWTWSPKPAQVASAHRRFSLRPGEAGSQFVSGPPKKLAEADRIEIAAVVADGRKARFSVGAAYLP